MLLITIPLLNLSACQQKPAYNWRVLKSRLKIGIQSIQPKTNNTLAESHKLNNTEKE
jgi:hypothetical protein